MIDPKLNEIPVKIPEGTIKDSEDQIPEAEKAGSVGTKSHGLSIFDTIAGDTTLSVGSRGVDTSGVVSGAGAGAGMTSSSPAIGDGSPAPNFVPGARSSGTTPRGDTASEQTQTTRSPAYEAEAETSVGSFSSDVVFSSVEKDEIAARAYQYWQERGSPHGSSDEDWHRAEQEVRARRQSSGQTRSATA